MSRWLKWAGILLGALGCGFFLVHAWRERDAFKTLATLEPHTLLAIAGSSLLFMLIYPITGWASFWILRDLGTRIHPRALIAILCVSQVARYLPGNIGQHIARTALLTDRGTPLSTAIFSLAFEALMALVVACALTAPYIFFMSSSILALQKFRISLGITISAGIILLLLLVLGYRLLPKSWARFISAIRAVRESTWLVYTLSYLFNYTVLGTGLYLIATAITPLANMPWSFITSFALAWIAGFIAPGLPAGLGVREGVLITLLQPTLGAGPAVVIVTLHRLSTIIGDAIAAIFGSVMLGFDPQAYVHQGNQKNRDQT